MRALLHVPAGGPWTDSASLVPWLAVTGIAAWILGGWVALLGPAVVALLLGTSIRTLGLLPSGLDRSAGTLGARLLQVSIVALGFSVDIGRIIEVA
ncbi:MAG: hypothetical protein ACRDGQ_07915, partial [Candidatus Limnocylindrales bacterium]